MSEQNFQPKPNLSTAMRAMTPTELEGHKIGVKLADEATLAEAGKEGATTQDMESVWRDSYTLGRNAVEEALGSDRPYAADRIREEEQK